MKSCFDPCTVVASLASLALSAASVAGAAGGDVGWQDRFDQAGGVDVVADLDLRGQKTVVVAGTLDDGSGSGDLFIRNYSFHTGVVVWESILDVEGDDAVGQILAKGNNVFTVGQADQGGNQDWVLTNLDRQ